jgi:hypothetical protein
MHLLIVLEPDLHSAVGSPLVAFTFHSSLRLDTRFPGQSGFALGETLTFELVLPLAAALHLYAFLSLVATFFFEAVLFFFFAMDLDFQAIFLSQRRCSSKHPCSWTPPYSSS